MNRLQACALVIVLWAAIYLPGLGSGEIRGEEGRRILPAMTMLETGNWLVPYVGGKPFLRKPPLINWLIAGSFALTGVRNEWTARLPSTLCVLVLGLTIVATSGPGWLMPGTAFVAAIFAMTQCGLLAKARFAGAEIEGIYAPLTGMAVVCWLAAWAKRRSAWRVWILPGMLLGVASLAKGPSLHLVFFYGVVAGVLWQTREWRWLWQPAHLVAIASGAAIFASWAIPYFRAPETSGAANVWKRQGIERFTENEFHAADYFLNLPRGLSDQLPWILFAPLALGVLRKKRGGLEKSAVDSGLSETASDEERLLCAFRGVAISSVVGFGLVLLIPGALPRYVLPLGAPLALVLGWAVCGAPIRERDLWKGILGGFAVVLGLLAFATWIAIYTTSEGRPKNPLPWLVPAAALIALVVTKRRNLFSAPALAAASALLLSAGLLIYCAVAQNWVAHGDDPRVLARAIDAAVPAGQILTLCDPSYLPAIFYLRTRIRYILDAESIPPEAHWVLARKKQGKHLAELKTGFSIAGIFPAGNEEFFLLQRAP